MLAGDNDNDGTEYTYEPNNAQKPPGSPDSGSGASGCVWGVVGVLFVLFLIGSAFGGDSTPACSTGTAAQQAACKTEAVSRHCPEALQPGWDGTC